MSQPLSSKESKLTTDSAPCSTELSDAHPLIEELSEYTLQLMWMLRQEAMRAFEPLGMRPIKALVLEMVGRGLVYPKALAEMLDALPPAVSALIADLEERGLLTRENDPDDKRKIRLELTPEGQTMRRRLKQTWHTAGAARLSRLSEDELTSLITIYQKLLRDE